MNLAIIPARGGSKGLPGKNIRELCGKPLIVWSIEAAQKSQKLDRVVVSTDSEEIANVAKQYRCEVLMRPAYLATDESTTISLVTHIANEIPEAKNFIVLQPTSPLRKDTLIDECIREFEKAAFTNLATGYYCKFQEFGTHNNIRRQDYQGFFYDDGNVYILSREIAVKGMWFGNSICRYEIEKFQNFEIDDEVDFFILEALIKKYKLQTD